MIVHVVVPILRHSLSPDKIAAHMNEMLDPDRDRVTAVTVMEEDTGRIEVWSINGEIEVFSND